MSSGMGISSSFINTLQPIFQMVHHSITRTPHDFTQPVGTSSWTIIYQWLSCAGHCVLLQPAASNDTIHPQAVRLLRDNSLHGPEVLSSITSLVFIPVICISMSLSQSTNSYRCLTQVNDTFLGSFHSCTSWTFNSCSASSLLKASTNAV